MREISRCRCVRARSAACRMSDVLPLGETAAGPVVDDGGGEGELAMANGGGGVRSSLRSSDVPRERCLWALGVGEEEDDRWWWWWGDGEAAAAAAAAALVDASACCCWRRAASRALRSFCAWRALSVFLACAGGRPSNAWSARARSSRSRRGRDQVGGTHAHVLGLVGREAKLGGGLAEPEVGDEPVGEGEGRRAAHAGAGCGGGWASSRSLVMDSTATARG